MSQLMDEYVDNLIEASEEINRYLDSRLQYKEMELLIALYRLLGIVSAMKRMRERELTGDEIERSKT